MLRLFHVFQLRAVHKAQTVTEASHIDALYTITILFGDKLNPFLIFIANLVNRINWIFVINRTN